ncbi:unnamed protein product [Mytilus coruscus]|uniref:Craniofacial development protein 1 n=1 Tax=Mytilus coruscus TaxID=42192 RepID=A0A6J8BNB0_MYTCO|nr:unnamed protein product [Mytilus coruscus]
MSDEEDYSSGSDEDYVPSDGEAVSEEECSGDEEDLELLKAEGGEDVKTSGKRKRKKKPDILQRKRKGGIKLEGEVVNKEETEEEIKARKQLEENIKEEQKLRKEEQEKKKADDLWSSFMSDVGTRPKPKASPSLVVMISVSSGSFPVTKEVDQNSKEAQSELKKQESVVSSTASPGLAAMSSVYSGLLFTQGLCPDTRVLFTQVYCSLRGLCPDTRVLFTQVYCSLRVCVLIQEFWFKKTVHLGFVLDKINKKQKISTLNKSKLDWDQFKKDNKLEEDLSLHNKKVKL